MVVVDDGEDTIHDSLVGLDQPHGNSKEDVNERICQLVYLQFDKAANRLLAKSRFALSMGKLGWIWEVWFHESFTLQCIEMRSM